ncbi:MAG: PAS domain S-box protein [Dehalococcoidales bacterium]|nr:PAS domain S-box protein [Dehalococcoidales bacterium]
MWTENNLSAEAMLQHYQQLYKYAGVMIFIFDSDLRLVEANNKALKRYGYKRRELAFISVKDMAAPQEYHDLFLQLRQGLSRRGCLYESLHQTSDGRTIPVEVDARMIRIEGKDYLQWIVRDISQRKDLETRLSLDMERIEHLNRVLRAIRNVNQLIIREKDPRNLLCGVSREMVKTRGINGCWIVLKDKDGGVSSFCESGWEGEGLTDEETGGLIDRCRCAAACLVEEKLITVKTMGPECVKCPLSARCEDEVVINAPLIDKEKKYGILAVTVGKKTFTGEDEDLVREIASDITFALRSIETEDGRRRLEEEVRLYLEIAGVMIVVLDRQGRIKLVNRKAAEILGYDEHELTGQDWFELCIPEKAAVRTAFNRIMAGDVDQAEYFVNPVIARDGTIKTISWHNAVVKDENGRIVSTIISGEDITYRQEAEQALLESEEKFRLLYENMDMGVVYQAKGGEVISLNPAAARMLGVSRDMIHTPELVNMNLPVVREDFTSFPAEEHPTMQALKTGQSVNNVVMGLSLDGGKSYRWMMVNAMPQFRPEEADPYQAFAIISDITPLKQFALELQEKQDFLDAVIDNTPNPLWISDSVGTIIRMNQSLRKLMKITDSEIIGKYNVLKDRQVIDQGYLPLVESVFNEGKTVHFTMEYHTSLEEQVNLEQKVQTVLELTISALRDEKGKVVNAICQHKDITRQRQSELALQKSEGNYRNSLENSPMGVRIFDTDDVTHYANRALLEIFGVRDIEEFNAIPIHRRYTPEAYRVFLERKQKWRENKPLSSLIETSIVRKDGIIRHLRVVRNEVLWDGQPRIQAIYQDITEESLMEEELLRSETKYRTLVNNVKLGVFRADPSGAGKFIEVNPAMEEITGYSRKELLTMKVSTLYVDRSERKKFIRQVVNSGEKASGEFRFRRKDGAVIQVFITDYAIRNDTGRVVFIDGILDDITERKQAEARLLEMESLKRSNKAKSELLANVSHELRTPLSSIKGFIETLLEEDVKWSEKQQREFLSAANMETDRLTFLIRDLLDMSRLDSGKMLLDRKESSIVKLFEDIRNVLASLTARHRLVYDVAPSLPAVMMDKNRIGQVITNLVENAAKFSAEGTEISIRVKQESGYIVFEVEDRGEGMPDEVVSNLFDRFYQAERVVSGKTRGTGLGLAICKGIVEAHDGKICVDSRPGRGSVFSFFLPFSTMKTRRNA